MSDTGHLKCPRCGKELPPSAPEGLCPACLGALNFATETNVTGADAKEALPPMTPAELAPHFPQLEILECLGRGGMGVVYKARQKSLNRLVALKLLAPERVQDAKFAERFAREAHALAALNHPSIVTVHDFGQAGGYYFLLMEFVDGVNLRQLLRSRKLQPAEALAIVPPVCEALQYAHEHGIVHRDIKPENLLLAKDGRVKIADFGIAKMLGSSATVDGGEGEGKILTADGATQQTTMGTPQYMAPEQREQPQIADHRADIYSLGVVLYELLTGELPTDKLQPPSRKVQIDVRLDEIVLRALEKTPELRYQTAGEFKTQVETIASTASEPPPLGAKTQPSLKSGRCYLTTREKLGTFNGQMFLYRDRYELVLDDRQLAFLSGGKTTIIPLASIRDLSLGRFPAAVNPAGLDFISVIYEEGGQSHELIFAPCESMFGAPGDFNAYVAEWLESIRSAVKAVTGKLPESRPVEQLAVSSSKTGFLAGAGMILIPALLGITLVAWLMQLGGGSSGSLSGMKIALASVIIMVGFFIPFLFRNFLGRKSVAVGFHAGTVVFYAGVILGTLFIELLSFQFSRDSAYLLVVGIMAVMSPFAGVMMGNAWRLAEQRQDQARLNQLKGRLKGLSVVAWILALPVVGFAIFFFLAMLSERGGWKPATSEAVIVPLTWLGAVLLPWAAMSLRRAGVETGADSLSGRTSGGGKFLWTVGALVVVLLVTGFVLLSANARRVAQAQIAARAAAERKVEESRRWATTVHKLEGSQFIARLPYGGSVELLAVRLHPGNTNQPWWKPDGSPSPYGPDITMESGNLTGSGVLGLAKIKWPQPPAGKEAYGVTLNGGRFALKDGLRVSMEEYSVIHFERVMVKGDEATLNVPVGVRDWETVMTLQPGAVSALTGGAARRQWKFSETSGGNLKVSIKRLTQQAGNEYRLAAMDQAGKLHTPGSTTISSTTGKLEVSFEALFDGVGSSQGLRPEQVKEVYWQIRPLDSIEFSRVSMKPGHLTKVFVREFAEEAPITPLSAALVGSHDTEVTTRVPTRFAVPLAPIVLITVLVAVFMGGVVLMVWLARKNGLKGCLFGVVVVGASILVVGLLVVLVYWGSSVREIRKGFQPIATLELSAINQNSPPATPNGLAMQVQNGLNLKVPPGQLVTFEVFIRQGDDRREPVPALTAVVATDEGDGINTWLSWMGKREDDGQGTNQLWSWSVNGNVLGAVPMANRTDYGTNMAWQVKPREVLNWWQLALPKNMTMSAGSIQEIALFRTFGSATTDPTQPKEIIARIKRHALPEEMKMAVGQYQMLLGLEAYEKVDAWNQKAGIGVKRVLETGAQAAVQIPGPTPLVSEEIVQLARKDYETTKLLMEAGRAEPFQLLEAETHLTWAEAMHAGDARRALEAKRDGAVEKYDRMKKLAIDRLSKSEVSKAARELAEAEAALKQFDLKEAK